MAAGRQYSASVVVDFGRESPARPAPCRQGCWGSRYTLRFQVIRGVILAIWTRRLGCVYFGLYSVAFSKRRHDLGDSMPQTVLEQLLERRLIPVDDDPTLEKVQTAADELAKKIRSGKIPATAATLVALDPQISPTEPLGDLVMVELRRHWKSVDQKHPDRPMTLVRGILADALQQAGKDPSVAAVVTLTARSYWPYTALHAELSVWEGVLQALGGRAEMAAAAAWEGTGKDALIEIPPFKFGSGRALGGKIDVSYLQKYLAAAAGPASDPPTGVTANTGAVTPQGYGTQPAWADNFGRIAAAGVAGAVNEALQVTAKSIDLSAAGDSLESFLRSLATQIDAAVRPIRATALRTEVLLWRESLFSVSLRSGYRRLSPAVRTLAQACDLHALVPAHSPVAVESLLEEAGRAVGDDEPMTIPDFLAALVQDFPAELASTVGKTKPHAGRGPLLALVREAVIEGSPPGSLGQRLGVDPNVPVPLYELALWMFRDLQADRLLGGK